MRLMLLTDQGDMPGGTEQTSMARLDYDEIKRGRRRDWEKLQDPEERKLREREEKEEERKQRESLLRRRERQRAEKAEHEVQTWEKTKRELKLYALIAGVALFLYIGFNLTSSLVRNSRQKARFQAVSAEVQTPGQFFTLSDPIGAWGTWRNAWHRRSVRDLYMMSWPARQDAVRGRRDVTRYLEEEQRRLDEGKLEYERSVATQFDDPVIVRLPRAPSPGQLAVFRSQPIVRQGVVEPPTEWVVAFAWNKTQEQWQLVDVRQAEYWRDKWAVAKDIQPVVYRPAQQRSLLE